MDNETHSTLDGASTSSRVPSPKPTTRSIPLHDEFEDASSPGASSVVDPPPPYPSRERRLRTNRSTRRVLQVSGDGSSAMVLPLEVPLSGPDSLSPHSPVTPLDDGTETTPLLSPYRRRRTLSHSTAVSTHSMAQTVLSLFQADDTDVHSEESMNRPITQDMTSSALASRRNFRRYFRPLWKGAYYKPLVHLLFINFPYALVAFVYCFVGTLTGTTLLIALPLGAVICWFNIVGARTFARGEIALQTRFHGPLSAQVPSTPYPIFLQPQQTPASTESGQPASSNQQSFLRNTFLMFTNQTSYQAIFYFIVIKPSITLFLTIALYIMIPAAFVLVFPAPAALRATKRIGVWQANIALEGLLQPRL